MNRQEIKQALQEVFEQALGKAVVLDDNMGPAQVEGWDSLAHVTLMLAVEKRFGVKFTGNEIANAGTVGHIVELLAAKLAK